MITRKEGSSKYKKGTKLSGNGMDLDAEKNAKSWRLYK